MAKKRKIIDERQSCAPAPQVTEDWEPQYVNRDTSPGQSNTQTSDTEQATQAFNNWHLCNYYFQPIIDADIYSRLEGDVTALTPVTIPEQPDDNWFEALADTPAVASPLETLAWLHAPNSPSLGKRVFHSETGPSTPRYGPAEYNTISGPSGLTGPTPGPTEPSGSIGQDNPEDCKAKRMRISRIILAEGHWCRSIGIPNDMTPEEYKTCDYCAGSLEEHWQPEEDCHDTEWSHGNDWNTDNTLDNLFMGNDSCLEDDSSEGYYIYDTDLTGHFSYLPYYTYDCDS